MTKWDLKEGVVPPRTKKMRRQKSGAAPEMNTAVMSKSRYDFYSMAVLLLSTPTWESVGQV